SRIWNVRSCTPRRSLSRIPSTAVAWNSRASFPTICSASSTSCERRKRHRDTAAMTNYPQTVFTGRVFSVELDRVRSSKGEHEIALVRHSPSVVLIPVRKDGRIVLVKQYRHALKRDVWELPAGSVDAGESVEQAAARECEEEIGLRPSTIVR